MQNTQRITRGSRQGSVRTRARGGRAASGPSPRSPGPVPAAGERADVGRAAFTIWLTALSRWPGGSRTLRESRATHMSPLSPFLFRASRLRRLGHTGARSSHPQSCAEGTRLTPILRSGNRGSERLSGSPAVTQLTVESRQKSHHHHLTGPPGHLPRGDPRACSPWGTGRGNGGREEGGLPPHLALLCPQSEGVLVPGGGPGRPVREGTYDDGYRGSGHRRSCHAKCRPQPPNASGCGA